MNAAKQFNKFAGRAVAVTETPYRHEFKNLGMVVEGVNAEYDPKDPVMTELFAAAAKAGLKVRVWLPETMGTADHRTYRLNVSIAKESDGVYRIQPGFNIG